MIARVTDRIRLWCAESAHRLRRRLVRRRLASVPIPTMVLFVCHGNLYRSPYAAARFRALLPEAMRHAVAVESAGFEAPGRAVPSAARERAAQRGIDLSAHRSSFLRREAVLEAELIVVVDPRHRDAICQRFGTPRSRVLLLSTLDQEPGSAAIEDPMGRPEETIDIAFDRIDRCVGELVKVLLAGETEEGETLIAR